MNILLTGGTGYIGRELCRLLLARGDTLWVYSRRPERVPGLCGAGVHAVSDLSEVEQLNLDAVVNLAGESIAGGLWTDNRKQKLRDSRIALTETLCHHLSRCEQPPRVFISGSATGYYGEGGDTLLTEDSSVQEDFAQQLCADWEAAAEPARDWGARLVLLRTGLVMGPDGGFLGPLMWPFRLGLGARLGSGQQWMSWIALSDMVRVIAFALDNADVTGPINAVAPAPVTNAGFTRTFASVLNRPAFLVTPAFALKLVLGELSTLLLTGQRAIPKRLQDYGFDFKHLHLESALEAAIR